eukprot:g3732.t1
MYEQIAMHVGRALQRLSEGVSAASTSQDPAIAVKNMARDLREAVEGAAGGGGDGDAAVGASNETQNANATDTTNSTEAGGNTTDPENTTEALGENPDGDNPVEAGTNLLERNREGREDGPESQFLAKGKGSQKGSNGTSGRGPRGKKSTTKRANLAPDLLASVMGTPYS